MTQNGNSPTEYKEYDGLALPNLRIKALGTNRGQAKFLSALGKVNPRLKARIYLPNLEHFRTDNAVTYSS